MVADMTQYKYSNNKYYALTFRYTSREPTNDIFRVVALNLFFAIWTDLINSNVFHNLIFIYYRDNHKCNIYNFRSTKMKKKKIQFFSGIQKVSL